MRGAFTSELVLAPSRIQFQHQVDGIIAKARVNPGTVRSIGSNELVNLIRLTASYQQ